MFREEQVLTGLNGEMCYQLLFSKTLINLVKKSQTVVPVICKICDVFGLKFCRISIFPGHNNSFILNDVFNYIFSKDSS